VTWLTQDGRLILAARGIRTFAYGFLSVLLGLYLDGLGFSAWQVGAVLTATLTGSALLTIVLASVADRYGRRRMLILSSTLMAGAGLLFAVTNRYPLLILASLTGTIGATSGEVGPFLTLEQAILPQTAPAKRRNLLFGVYNMVGGLAGAGGALFAATPALLQSRYAFTELTALRLMFVFYAILAGAALMLILRLSDRVELAPEDRAQGGTLQESKPIVLRLAAVFGLDSLAGGFVVQSLIAFWFHLRWGAGPELLGPIFLGVGLLQSASYLVAARVADRIGLINTMVFTHLPSNILLMLVPVAPTLQAATILILARHALSQMDVPTRQSYIMAVVAPRERAAAAGYTNVVRNLAQAITPVISGYAMQVISLGLPFIIGGGLKIIYDLTLFAMFRSIREPQEPQ
jgi:MFS family permease